MLDNKEIMAIALQQSAYDCNCKPEDFTKSENVIVNSYKNNKARNYLPLPLECDLVSYGNNIVAQVSDRTRDKVKKYIEKYEIYHCFETPNIYTLNNALSEYNLEVCFMAEYFLPDVTQLKELKCEYELRILQQSDFADLYDGTWVNAICEAKKELDVFGEGAYDKGILIGLAACSADCDNMYQIGVDVLPQYRRQGIASSLTSKLAIEILSLGKVPFYCAAWSNIRSVKNEIRSGFKPGWVELTARDKEFVKKMIK